MATFVNDTFTEAGGSSTALASHTGETGATWTVKSGSNVAKVDNSTDRVWASQASDIVYYTSGVPGSADYSVQMDYFPVVLTGGQYMGVMGRLTTTSPDNYYSLEYNVSNTRWEVWKAVGAGPTFTMLGSFSQTLTTSTTYVGKLEMISTAIKGYVDTVQRVSVTDSAITAAGRAGLDGLGAPLVGNAFNVDNFSAFDAVSGPTILLLNQIPSTLVRM